MTCVHDIIVVFGLAIRTSIAYKDAPHDYRHISEDVAVLKLLIDRVSSYVKRNTISSNDCHHVQEVLKGCQGVLEDLMALIEKYKRLACINKKIVLNGVKVGKDNITTLQVRLMSYTGLLNGFVRCCEYTEVQAQLSALLGLHGTANLGISITSIASFAANTNTNTNTETAYKQFCNDLYGIGVAKDIVRQNKDKMLEILRSRSMISGSKTKKKDTNSSSSKNMPSFRLTSEVNWFESSSEAGSAPLAISASHSHIGIVELVFGEGSSTDQYNTNPFRTTPLRATPLCTTPLHAAAKGGYTWLAELLLGSTPPSKGRPIGIMELLFSKGASLDARDKGKNTPLQLAIMNGHTDIVDLLLRKGSSIGDDYWGWTPLHLATQKGYTGVVELLLSSGASTEVKDRLSGTTLLHGAAEYGHTGMVELLLNFRQGASIEARNNLGYTPLHFAASKGHTVVVGLLLEKGASINAKDGFDSTPLHNAAINGHTSTVKLLLEKGASPEAKNKINKIPLHYAEKYNYSEMAQLLKNKAAELRPAQPSFLASIFGY